MDGNPFISTAGALGYELNLIKPILQGQSDHMNCPSCNHINPADALFCVNCGAKQLMHCPKCETSNDLDSKFCKHCGNKLQPDPGPSHRLKAVDGPEKDQARAERRQLTCLFCDLVGSTALSEQLDAEDFRQVVLDYWHTAEGVIAEYGGHVAQYLGDGLLVYFGYPHGLEDAPRAAINTGLGILEAVSDANAQGKSSGKIEINVRIGIHTGLVVVDNHLALGDTVNIAARLEGLSPVNGVVISEHTLMLVRGWFEVLSLGKKDLKGISEPIEVFQVIGQSGVETQLEVRSRRGLSPLVGRDQELELLHRTWKLAKESRGQLMVLSGEAGIGKSRLSADLQNQVSEESNSFVLELRCSDHHVNSPYYPIIDVLNRRVFAFEKDENSESKINKLIKWLDSNAIERKPNLPIFADLLSIPLAEVSRAEYEMKLLAPAGRKKKFQDGFTKAMLNYALKGPFLLSIDDLHWMDQSTLEWLESLVTCIHPHPIFVLCTTRPQFQPTWKQKSHITQLNLDRLSGAKMEAICYHQTKGKQLPPEVLGQIKAKTDGVPLFVEELTRMIIESNLLVEKTNHYELKGDLSDLSIPSTLQDSLTARLDQLADAKEIAQVGSVLGRSFSFELLLAVTRKDRRSMEEDLSKLIDRELLYQRGMVPECSYIFKHALVQDAAYGSLLKKRRRELHEDVAEVLQSQFQELIKNQPEVLANHLTEAGQYQKALLRWEEAGNLAVNNNANQEAVPHFEKSLSLLKYIPQLAERNSKELDLLLPYNSVLMLTRGWYHPTLEEIVQRIIDLCEKEQNDEKYLFALIGLVLNNFLKGNIKTAEGLAQKGIKRARLINNDKYFIFFLTFSGVVHHIRGNFKKARSCFQSSLETYDPVLHGDMTSFGVGEISGWASIHYAWELLALGYPDQARNIMQNLPMSFEGPEDMATIHRRHVDKGLAHYILKEYGLAFQEVQSFLPIVKESGDSFYLTMADLFLQFYSCFAGMSFNGIEKIVTTLDQFDRLGLLIWAPLYHNMTAEVLFKKRDYKQALLYNEKATKFAEKIDEKWWLSAIYKLQGEIVLAKDKDMQEAEYQFHQAIQIAQQQSAKWHELQAAISLARLWQSQDKTTEAYELLNGIYSWFTEGFDTVDMKEAKELLEVLEK